VGVWIKNKDLGNVLIFCFGFMVMVVGLGVFVLCRGVVVMGFIIVCIIRKGVLGIFLGLGIVDIGGREVAFHGGCRRFGGRFRP